MGLEFRWLEHRGSRHRCRRRAFDITARDAGSLRGPVDPGKATRFTGEPSYRADGYVLDGFELALYMRFILRKVLGNVQDLRAQRGRNTQTQYSQCRHGNEY